jgi:uncharacterized protein YutE (UPF0331/DUF86 family)
VSGAGDRLLAQAMAGVAGGRRRLDRSLVQLAGRFPIDADRVAELSPTDEDAIDAFLKRYEQLVTTLQDQAFRAIARLEREDLRAASRRDVAELMAKLGAIPSAERFGSLVDTRNRLAQTYPDDPARQAAILNTAFDAAREAVAIADHLRAFVDDRYGTRGSATAG